MSRLTRIWGEKAGEQIALRDKGFQRLWHVPGSPEGYAHTH